MHNKFSLHIILIEELCKIIFSFIFIKFISVSLLRSFYSCMRQKIHTPNETHFYAKCFALWHYNPLKNITYHRIMNAIIIMLFVEQDSNELYTKWLSFWFSPKFDDGACIQIRNGTLALRGEVVFRELLINTLIMVSWY